MCKIIEVENKGTSQIDYKVGLIFNFLNIEVLGKKYSNWLQSMGFFFDNVGQYGDVKYSTWLRNVSFLFSRKYNNEYEVYLYW